MRVGRPVKPLPQPACPYCASKATLLRVGDPGYPYEDRDYGPTWTCAPCGAWVGCHKNSRRHVPLGRLADADLRKMKSSVHAVFDALWQAKMRRDGCSQSEARNAGYRWLAQQMGIETNACHVGMFDTEQCQKALDIMSNLRRRKNA